MIYHGALPPSRTHHGIRHLRTQKHASGIAIRRSLTHAFREQETPNADPSRTSQNTHIGAADVGEALANLNERLATQDKVRKNAVLAVEYMITASLKDMRGKSRQEQDAYFRDALKWVEDKHDKANVIYAGIHQDEQTPHMYAYVVPLDGRGKLNCRSFLGGAKALPQMQTEFSQEVGQQHGLQRGIEGSKARHTSIQQYYSRVSKTFEPLPEVKTPAPKLRPEPEKPGLFAEKDAKEAYQLDRDAWQREQSAAQLQNQQHMAEVRVQRDTAIEVAKRHQAQAEVAQLKQSNGVYAKTVAQRKAEVVKLLAVVDLFTPEEILAAQARKQQQEAEKARLAELTRSKAAEVASTEAEVARRVQDVQKLLQRGGAEHTFWVRAATALREAGGDASRVDWKAAETRVIIDATGRHWQSAENVTRALLTHSPLRADSASHAQLRNTIKLNTPQLEAKYQQDRATRDRDSGHRPR
jgi:hypothetical protein